MEGNNGLTTVTVGDSNPPAEPTEPQLDPAMAPLLEGLPLIQPKVVKPRLPSDANFANDESMQQQLSDLFMLLQYTRQERRQLELQWDEINRMDLMQHDDNRKYLGRSKAYLPIAARNFDTIVASLSTGLFPTDDYLDVTSRDDTTEASDAAKVVKGYIQWEFETVTQIRRHIKPFLRQLAKLGSSVGKYRYRREVMEKGKLAKDGKTYSGLFGQSCIDGLQFDTRPMHHWYIYPSTAPSVDEAVLVFEDIAVHRSTIEKMIRTKLWVNEDDAINVGTNVEAERAQQEWRERFKLTTTPETQNPAGGGLSDIKFLTEAWVRLKLPASAYMDDEDTEAPIPCKVVMTNTGRALEVRRNPHWDQRPPYLAGRLNVQAGIFYGQGFGQKIQPMQYLANDFANQTNDNGNYALNPIIKRIPHMMVGPQRPIAPGVVWDVHQADAITFDRPPVEQVQYGIQMLQLWLGFGQELGGAPAIMQGTRGAKTATTSQILQKQAAVPLQDLVQDLELEVMIPLMRASFMFAQQFRREEVVVKVAGKSFKVTPDVFTMDADFRWLASSQSVNAQQRAQQAIQLLSAIVPLIPIMQQQGYQFDPVPMIHRLYSDGMGFRNFDQVVKKGAVPPPGMPGPGTPPGPGAGAPPPQDDRIRSALETIGGQGTEMVPGEGEEFMNVRANADELAAMMGEME